MPRLVPYVRKSWSFGVGIKMWNGKITSGIKVSQFYARCRLSSGRKEKQLLALIGFQFPFCKYTRRQTTPFSNTPSAKCEGKLLRFAIPC